MSFFAALNALGISMLGEYVVRIYDEVRGRPLYLVDRTVNCAVEQTTTDAAVEMNVKSNDWPLASSTLDLSRLDPLEFTDPWDDAYQHLLDQANDLVELGALAQAEANDLAQRTNDSVDEDQPPSVLKFSEAPPAK